MSSPPLVKLDGMTSSKILSSPGISQSQSEIIVGLFLAGGTTLWTLQRSLLYWCAINSTPSIKKQATWSLLIRGDGEDNKDSNTVM